MSKKNHIIKHQSTKVVLKQAQNLMDITNSILQNNKRELVKKDTSQIVV